MAAGTPATGAGPFIEGKYGVKVTENGQIGAEIYCAGACTCLIVRVKGQ